MRSARITFSGPPGPYELEALLEALCRGNTRWYLEEWRQGRDPACCVECAGCTHRPDGRRLEHRFAPARDVLARPRAGWSCKELAAVDCGAKRARAIQQGSSWEDAERAYRVVLEDGRGARHENAGSWHAIVQTPNGYEDPTADLKRVA